MCDVKVEEGDTCYDCLVRIVDGRKCNWDTWRFELYGWVFAVYGLGYDTCFCMIGYRIISVVSTADVEVVTYTFVYAKGRSSSLIEKYCLTICLYCKNLMDMYFSILFVFCVNFCKQTV